MIKNIILSGIFTLFLATNSAALTGKIVNVNGVPRLTLNGKPVTPTMFYVNYDSSTIDTFWSELNIATQNGINIFSFSIDLPWTTKETAADFSDIDKLFTEIIQRYPQLLIIPKFSVSEVPDWWIKENPDELMLYDNGKRGIPSVASEKWRTDAQEMVHNFVQHLESKFGNHILGYHLCAQNTGEWFYDGIWDNVLPGFEPVMLSAFRQWLRIKYADNPTLLQQAWNDDRAEFPKLVLPAVDKRTQTVSGCLRDPAIDRRVIDFFTFQQDIMVEPIKLFAHEIKTITKNQKLVLCYYGYSFELSALPYGPQISGHLALSRLLRNKDIDIICSPLSYLNRNSGGAASVMLPVDSVQLANKLWLMEDDTRTYLAGQNEIGAITNNIDDTRWIHQRNFGHTLIRNSICSWTDLKGKGWLNDKEIWDNLTKLKDLSGQHLSKSGQYKPEVAVILDEKSMFYLSTDSKITSPLISEIRQQLSSIGTPAGYYLLDDLIEGKIKSAKLYIFLNTFCITQQQQNEIKKILNKGRKTAVWFYAPGFFDEREGVTENIEKLTGFKTERISTPITAKVVPAPNNERARLVLPLKEQFGLENSIVPLFNIVPDNKMYLIANYEGTDKIAVAMKSSNRWTSIFIGIPTISVDFLRSIAKYAGVHFYLDSNDIVDTDDKVVFIHAKNDGVKRIKLKMPCLVNDAITGEMLSMGRVITTIELRMETGQTRILLLR